MKSLFTVTGPNLKILFCLTPIVASLIVAGISGAEVRHSHISSSGQPSPFAFEVANQSASWTISWNSSLQGNCSGTPSSGTLFLHNENTITKIGPNGQEWTTALPEGYSLLPNPGSNPSCVVSSNGDVYFYMGGPDGNSIVALNSQGLFEWSYTPSGFKLTGISASAGINDEVYVTGISPCYCSQLLVAISADKFPLWNVTEPLSQYGISESYLSPVFSPTGTMFLTIQGYQGGTELIALNAQNGTTEWSFVFNTQNHVLGPSFAPDGTVFVRADTEFFAFTPQGKLKWQTNLPAGLGAIFPGQIMINSNNTVIVNIEYPSTFLEFNSTDGAQIWNHTLSSNLFNLSWMLGVSRYGTIFVQQFKYDYAPIMNGSILYGYSSNGTLKWTLPIDLAPPVEVTGPGLFVDNSGNALVISANNILYSVRDNGSVEWQLALDSALPVSGIDTGVPLYIWFEQSNESLLYAMDAQAYSPQSTTTYVISLYSSSITQIATTKSSTSSQQLSSAETQSNTSNTTLKAGISSTTLEIGVTLSAVVVAALSVIVVLRRRI
jgi:outer membrane protein assembly factor BamB